MFPWCLVAFQKIFRKIFSDVWKRRRKTQIQKNTSHNLEKKSSMTTLNTVRRPCHRSRSRLLREIAIDGAISRRRDRDLREIAIDGAISRSVDGDLDPVQSCKGEIAIDGAISRSVDGDLDPVRSREGEIAILIRCERDLDPVARSRSTARSRDSEIAINGDWNVCRQDRDRRGLEIAIARARSLSLSFSGNTLKGK